MTIPLRIPWNNSWYNIPATLVYQSGQVLRFSVKGSKSSLLLECNYPLLYSSQSKKGVKWQLKEGFIPDAGLLHAIIAALEQCIKEQYPSGFSDK